MKRIKRIRRCAGVLAALAGTLIAVGAAAPAALALTVPPGPDRPAVLPPSVQIHTVVTGGMPGWQITLIAVGAALLAAAAALLLDRARAARRHVNATTA